MSNNAEQYGQPTTIPVSTGPEQGDVESEMELIAHEQERLAGTGFKGYGGYYE